VVAALDHLIGRGSSRVERRAGSSGAPWTRSSSRCPRLSGR
jgi:hypothetical protein